MAFFTALKVPVLDAIGEPAHGFFVQGAQTLAQGPHRLAPAITRVTHTKVGLALRQGAYKQMRAVRVHRHIMTLRRLGNRDQP